MASRAVFDDAANLARQIVDDRDVTAGVVFDDASIMYQFGSSIQRKIFRMMTINGFESANSMTAGLAIAANTDSHIDWTDPAGGHLPNDFLLPLVLWEKASGEPDSAYIEMDNTKETLPDMDPADTIRYWVWEDSGPNSTPAIKFITPSANRVVRILYQREPATFSSGSTPLYVPGSVDAMASGMVWMACASRGSVMTAASKSQFLEDMDELMRQARKGEQRRPRRRRPYSWMKFLRG